MASTSTPALELPIQLFAVTVIGMLLSLVRYHRTGAVDHWPVYIAYLALWFFFIGLLAVGLDALR